MLDNLNNDKHTENANIIVREGTKEDIDAVEQIAIAAWEGIYAGYQSQLGDEVYEKYFTSDWRKVKAAGIRRTVEAGSAKLYVTEKDGKIAAFIIFITDKEKKTGIISNNAVNPAYQGFGIGSAQYRYVFDLMREEGIGYVTVTTGLDEAHAPARRAYEKAGFSKQLHNVTYYKKL